MFKDYINYNNKLYQVSTVTLPQYGMETMIFPVKGGIVSGKEVYCFRTTKPGEAVHKHMDIYAHPEKYLSEEAINAYFKSKEDDLI